MKRDFNLIRAILITVENATKDVTLSELLTLNNDIDVLAFNTELMRSAGLVEACITYDGLSKTALEISISRITWEGYDLLDAIRSPRIWESARVSVAQILGDTSLSIVKYTCEIIAKRLINTHING